MVSVSSRGHKFSGIRWDLVQWEEPYDKWQAYGQAKTANILFAVELDARGKEEGIRAFEVYPAGVRTPLQRHLSQQEMHDLGWYDEHGNLAPLFMTPEQAGRSPLAMSALPSTAIPGKHCSSPTPNLTAATSNHVFSSPESPTANMAAFPWTCRQSARSQMLSPNEKYAPSATGPDPGALLAARNPRQASACFQAGAQAVLAASPSSTAATWLRTHRASACRRALLPLVPGDSEPDDELDASSLEIAEVPVLAEIALFGRLASIRRLLFALPQEKSSIVVTAAA